MITVAPHLAEPHGRTPTSTCTVSSRARVFDAAREEPGGFIVENELAWFTVAPVPDDA